MAKFPYINPQGKPKRLEELSRNQQEDLVFDLINAFALVRDPLNSALLLQDLLTSAEIKNISKRLRIAKLLLEGRIHEEITKELRCSFGTVAKVKAWLNEAGDGLKNVLRKLPERKKRYEMKRGILGHYVLPEVFLASYINYLEGSERKRVENFLKSAEKKKELFETIQQTIDEQFVQQRKARKFS